MEQGNKAVLKSDLAKVTKASSKNKRKRDYAPTVEACDAVTEAMPSIFVSVSAPTITDTVSAALATEVSYGANIVEVSDSVSVERDVN